jgi:hypothetical protein
MLSTRDVEALLFAVVDAVLVGEMNDWEWGYGTREEIEHATQHLGWWRSTWTSSG